MRKTDPILTIRFPKGSICRRNRSEFDLGKSSGCGTVVKWEMGASVEANFLLLGCSEKQVALKNLQEKSIFGLGEEKDHLFHH